jgi:lysine 2,3-aminomutase
MIQTSNWKSEFQQAFRSCKELYQFLGWQNIDAQTIEKEYSIFIPRQLAEKIKAQGPEGILAREFLPNINELHHQGLLDPIGDKTHYKAPQIIHRYSSRVLFTPTSICPVHCRYCFRKNELNPTEELFQQDFVKTLDYLNNHQEISEIIFTGGDPFSLSNEKLTNYLLAFEKISHIQDIRFHSRYPVILPQRFDKELLDLLDHFAGKFRTLSVAIHANHADEFDHSSITLLKQLASTNIQLLSQTVLLRDINNNVETLLELFNLFIKLKIRPYYLHHPDQVKGGMHFYLPLSEGRKLYGQLRSHLPGWAIPHYVYDIPGGAGKTQAYNPESYNFSGHFLAPDGSRHGIQEPDKSTFS